MLKTAHGVCFNPDNHTYTNLETNEKYTSGTSFIGKFHKKFDSRAVATNLVENHPKYQGRTVEEVLAEWEKAADMGTTVHNFLEDYLLDKLTPQLENKSEEYLTRINNLTNAWDRLQLRESHSDWEFVPEMLLVNHQHKVAGQSDLVLLNHKDKTFKILDYKTNKKGIEKTSYKDKRMYAPVYHLQDCKLIHYSLQLSLYAYMLEETLGYTCNGLELLWVDTNHPIEVNIEKIPVFYYKKEIQDMLTTEPAWLIEELVEWEIFVLELVEGSLFASMVTVFTNAVINF